MRETLKPKEIKYKVEEGFIHAKFIFQLIGSPKKHVEETIRKYIDDIAARKDVTVVKEDYDKAEETEGGLWSVIADVDILVKEPGILTFFCINYMPASVEILAPAQIAFSDKNMTDWLSDLLAKLHEVSVAAKQVRTQNEGIVRSINTLAKNYLIHLIEEGNDTIPSLETKTGMDTETVTKFLEALVKEKRIGASLDKIAIAKDLGAPVKEAQALPEPAKQKSRPSKR